MRKAKEVERQQELLDDHTAWFAYIMKNKEY